jgi:hypothetical protein
MAIILIFLPICGAANHTPSYSYIKSIKSSAKVFKLLSIKNISALLVLKILLSDHICIG